MSKLSKYSLWMLLILGLDLHAQTPTGQITGVITDPSGAIVPEA
jgi:hypothetical protein